MRLEALEDESLVIGGLLLNYLHEVLIDFVVVDGPEGSHLSSFTLALNLAVRTSSKGVSFLTFSSFKSMSELSSLLSFLSKLSIFSIIIEVDFFLNKGRKLKRTLIARYPINNSSMDSCNSHSPIRTVASTILIYLTA